MTNDISQVSLSRCVTKHVNRIEDEDTNQKKRNSTGLMKVSGLSNKRYKQSDPCLAWMVFHNIVQMYYGMKNEENNN